MLDTPVAASREKQRFAEEGRGPLGTGLFSTVLRLRNMQLGHSDHRVTWSHGSVPEKEVSGTPLLHPGPGGPVSVPWLSSLHGAYSSQQGPPRHYPGSLSVSGRGDKHP